MTELKPCPFEKTGEKHHIEAIETRPGYGYIYCFDCEFAFPGEEELSADVLADRWNTRAERTCKIARVETGEPAEYDCDEVLWHCESCHEEVAIYAYNENRDTWADKPAFCPNCGAKVVE